MSLVIEMVSVPPYWGFAGAGFGASGFGGTGFGASAFGASGFGGAGFGAGAQEAVNNAAAIKQLAISHPFFIFTAPPLLLSLGHAVPWLSHCHRVLLGLGG